MFDTLWVWSFLFRKQGLGATNFVTSHKISNRDDVLLNAEKDGKDQWEESSQAQGAKSEVYKVASGRSV